MVQFNKTQCRMGKPHSVSQRTGHLSPEITRKTALDRGRTDRTNLTHDLDRIYDTDFQFPPSCRHVWSFTYKSSTSTVNGFRSRVETNGRKDRRTDGLMDRVKCITSLANVVGNSRGLNIKACDLWLTRRFVFSSSSIKLRPT